MTDNMQTVIICALLSVLAIATHIQWFASPRNHKKYSKTRKSITLLAAAFFGPIFWLSLTAIIEMIPENLESWVLNAVILLFAAYAYFWPAKFSKQEECSQKRIVYGIIIGSTLLIAFCLIKFWPR